MSSIRSRSLVRPLEPPLKWAGGKRWLLDTLRIIYGQYSGRRLVEPFVGGMAVALGLMPEAAYLSDINPHLINFYRHLQDGLTINERVQQFMDATPETRENSFYEARKLFNKVIADGSDSLLAAELFYYLNRTCFNGLCRFNNRGEFNVPFGRYKTINYMKDFTPYKKLLGSRNWEIRPGTYENIEIQENDFVYADPPYHVEFTKYAKEDFTLAHQEELADWLARFDVPVVASNQATEQMKALYQSRGFHIETLYAPRRISCTGDRTPAEEMLALKNIAPAVIKKVEEHIARAQRPTGTGREENLFPLMPAQPLQADAE
jgi:DNA adenine methylase